MLTIRPFRDGAGGSHLDVNGYFDRTKTIQIQFEFGEKMQERQVIKAIEEIIRAGQYTWLRRHGDLWEVDADILVQRINAYHNLPAWFRGRITVRLSCESDEILPMPRMGYDNKILPPEPSFYRHFKTLATLTIDEEIVSEQAPKKIFLSHKSLDKTMVRRYGNALTTMGFEVWLDEDAMPAGTPLERGLSSGFKDSCAAVFFITPNYVDKGFLETEINYALREKRDKGDRFSIIALVKRDEDGRQGEVPELLNQYVFKPVEHELDGLVEILRGLPIKLGLPDWK
ncbi:MAG: hypothetical protein JWQ80_3030 [Massilia sp.]|nr:hypothetical protein [Massilia sp.]